MNEKILKAAYEIAYGEYPEDYLDLEELQEAKELADFLCCPNCGE